MARALPTGAAAVAGTGHFRGDPRSLERTSRAPRPATSSPTSAGGRLQGFDLLYLDLASERAQAAGVHVVKAVVPGLEVETVSSGRVGARNLQRLLARGGPLVGLGDPPPMGVPIRLSEVARALRSLYPLYRESGRHPARFGNP